jgi:hypothetical protein
MDRWKGRAWRAYLRLTLSDGRRFRVPVSEVSGQPFYAMEIRPGPAIAGWSAFDAAGHRLYIGRGARCPWLIILVRPWLVKVAVGPRRRDRWS